jgi:transposase
MRREKRQTYTAEFTCEAVRLVTEHGYRVAAAARHVGLHAQMLQRWNRALAARANGAFPGKGRRSPDQEEVHYLREDQKRLRMERDLLKKALSCVASESTCDRP